MHPDAVIFPADRFAGRLGAVNVAKIAFGDSPLFQHLQNPPALHIVVYRRIMEKHYRPQAQLFRLVQRGPEASCFPADDFLILRRFVII